jgi:hypothetical protein
LGFHSFTFYDLDYEEPNEHLDLERAAGEGENRSQETDTAGIGDKLL